MEGKINGIIQFTHQWILAFTIFSGFFQGENLCEGFAIQNGVVGQPEVQCTESSVIFSVRTEDVFRGNIYIKGKYLSRSCRKEFYRNDYNGATFRVDIGQCGMRRIRQLRPNGMNYILVFVVNFHSQFVTKVDRAYNVQCFYEQIDNRVSSQLEISMLTTQSLSEKTAFAPNCEYSVRLNTINGPVVRYAEVGQRLFHVWKCDTAGTEYGMLVKNCFVNDGKGSSVRVLDVRGFGVFDFVSNHNVTNGNTVNINNQNGGTSVSSYGGSDVGPGAAPPPSPLGGAANPTAANFKATRSNVQRVLATSDPENFVRNFPPGLKRSRQVLDAQPRLGSSDPKTPSSDSHPSRETAEKDLSRHDEFAAARRLEGDGLSVCLNGTAIGLLLSIFLITLFLTLALIAYILYEKHRYNEENRGGGSRGGDFIGNSRNVNQHKGNRSLWTRLNLLNWAGRKGFDHYRNRDDSTVSSHSSFQSSQKDQFDQAPC